jgi:AFG3 family protein
MAKALVMSYGMSKLGYRVYETSEGSFSKMYSEETDKKIDLEVNMIISECMHRTRNIIQQYKEQISTISEALLAKETIDVLDIIKLIGERPFPMPKSMNAYIEETKERRRKLQEEIEEREAELAKEQEKEEESTTKEPEQPIEDKNNKI